MAGGTHGRGFAAMKSSGNTPSHLSPASSTPSFDHFASDDPSYQSSPNASALSDFFALPTPAQYPEDNEPVYPFQQQPGGMSIDGNGLTRVYSGRATFDRLSGMETVARCENLDMDLGQDPTFEGFVPEAASDGYASLHSSPPTHIAEARPMQIPGQQFNGPQQSRNKNTGRIEIQVLGADGGKAIYGASTHPVPMPASPVQGAASPTAPAWQGGRYNIGAQYEIPQQQIDWEQVNSQQGPQTSSFGTHIPGTLTHGTYAPEMDNVQPIQRGLPYAQPPSSHPANQTRHQAAPAPKALSMLVGLDGTGRLIEVTPQPNPLHPDNWPVRDGDDSFDGDGDDSFDGDGDESFGGDGDEPYDDDVDDTVAAVTTPAPARPTRVNTRTHQNNVVARFANGSNYGADIRNRPSVQALPPTGIDISAVEILTFYPNALQHPLVVMRLTKAGWSKKDMAKVQLYATGNLTKAALKRNENRIQKQIGAGGKALCQVGRDERWNSTAALQGFTFDDLKADGWQFRHYHDSSYDNLRWADVSLASLMAGVVNWPTGPDRLLLTECLAWASANPKAPGQPQYTIADFKGILQFLTTRGLPVPQRMNSAYDKQALTRAKAIGDPVN